MKVKYQLALLLKSLKKKRSLASLRDYGLSAQRIYLLLSLALRRRYVDPNNGFFIVNECGDYWLKNLILHKDNWICKQMNMKVKKLSRNEIYLPKVKNTYFET